MEYRNPYARGRANSVRSEWSTGSKLERWLYDHKVSKNRLVELSGVPWSTVSRLCGGDRIGSIETWLRISRALGVPLSEIIEPEVMHGGEPVQARRG